MSRAMAYRHCHLRSSGQWTIPVGRPLSERVRGIMEISGSFDRDEEVYLTDDSSLL